MPGKHSEEKQHNLDAFEHYYSLGGIASDANYRKVAEEAGVTWRTIVTWAKKYNWRERIKQRNIDIARRTNEKVVEEVSDIKAGHRKALAESMTIVRASIRKGVEINDDGNVVGVKIEPANASDMAKLVNAYTNMLKTDLTLIGETPEQKEIVLRIVGVELVKYPEQK